MLLATVTNKDNKKDRHKFTFERCINQGARGTTLKFYCVPDYLNYGKERDIKIEESIDVWLSMAKWDIEIDGDRDARFFEEECEKHRKEIFVKEITTENNFTKNWDVAVQQANKYKGKHRDLNE